MSGNSFGRVLRLTTCGESHGPALAGILDGCPPGLPISEADIQADLDNRRPGTSRHTTQRQESDSVEIVSGVFEGVTTGTSIGLVVRNQDAKSKDYNNIKDKFRPGHADYTYFHKYGVRDWRGSGRASARETVMRVAGGAIARQLLLKLCNLEIKAHVQQIGDVVAQSYDEQAINIDNLFMPDATAAKRAAELITQLREQRDSCGALVQVRARNVPVGLGAPVFAKLNADLAAAMMGINAVKAVGIGAGFGVVTQRGSEHRDELSSSDGFLSNNAGGILGGISSGQDIVMDIAFKPTSSIAQDGRSIDTSGADCNVRTLGRHDPCVGIRAPAIVEAMMALVLADHYLLNRAQTSVL